MCTHMCEYLNHSLSGGFNSLCGLIYIYKWYHIVLKRDSSAATRAVRGTVENKMKFSIHKSRKDYSLSVSLFYIHSCKTNRKFWVIVQGSYCTLNIVQSYVCMYVCIYCVRIFYCFFSTLWPFTPSLCIVVVGYAENEDKRTVARMLRIRFCIFGVKFRHEHCFVLKTILFQIICS